MQEQNNSKEIKHLALIKNRHNIPQAVDGYIFKEIPDPTNLHDIVNRLYNGLDSVYVDKLVVYVTGLTVALVEVINFCTLCDIELTLMHYDNSTGKYFPQDVFIGGSYKIVREQMRDLTKEESEGKNN